MHYVIVLKAVKMIILDKKCDIFNLIIFAQTTEHGYMLEPH